MLKLCRMGSIHSDLSRVVKELTSRAQQGGALRDAKGPLMHCTSDRCISLTGHMPKRKDSEASEIRCRKNHAARQDHQSQKVTPGWP